MHNSFFEVCGTVNPEKLKLKLHGDTPSTKNIKPLHFSFSDKNNLFKTKKFLKIILFYKCTKEPKIV